MKELLQYLEDKKIVYETIDDQLVYIDGQKFQLITPVDGKLFDNDFHLIVDEILGDNFVFNFGGQWYYMSSELVEKPQLTKLRYLGDLRCDITTLSFLGVRGMYELLNGSGHYSEWVKKAKFLGVKYLGICEKNTLAGVLRFQNECENYGVNSIIGATYTVYQSKKDYRYDIKCYVINQQGWENLLLINSEVNVFNHKFIKEERFLELLEGLVVVLDPKSVEFTNITQFLDQSKVYYQLDTVEYEDEERDREYLLNLKKFVDSKLSPISITDAFYLDREDDIVKTRLNQISGVKEYKSSNQFFKSKEEYFQELEVLFKTDDRLFDYFEEALLNELLVCSQCSFQIKSDKKHLPVYKMTVEQNREYRNNEDMFWGLITKGLAQKVPIEKYDKYLDRVKSEVEVIKLGRFIDYFLILWDIIQWSNKNGILTGIGRGSAGGCLVAYCLDITHLDPIEFELLFERFLNRGRVEGGSLPDIDCDFAGDRRDEVKHYMEERYGKYQVCSVGTYTTLQLKAAIKDLSRIYNISVEDANWITTVLDDEDDSLSGIFKNALQFSRIMNFVQDNVDLVNDLGSVLKLPRSQSVHACATIILPEGRDIFHWVPVKSVQTKDGESLLVSEWEGGELESIGLLKEDILGIRQLDKFQFILSLIEKNKGEKLDIYNLPYDDYAVYKYFRNGWNQDVFHFGAKGLTKYCKESKPENIQDLIAAISLYRPGPIESNLHNEYILRKEGQKEVEYLWGTKSITEETYGILIYQEQIMQTCVQVGGFSLIEADEIRKALGKMKKKYSDPYRERFIEGAIDRGCSQEEAENIWEVMERFALYGFNKSHAAAYTITGYICQYLKVHYPVEFWTSAFQFIDESKREERTFQFVSEINKTGRIKVEPPDINVSEAIVQSNSEKNIIYWTLSSVKQVGGIAMEQILSERSKNGKYFSFEEFVQRHTFSGSKVNKLHIENLIYAGAFDQIEDVQSSNQRKRLLELYRERRKIQVDKERDLFVLGGDLVYYNWWWDLQQKRLTGIAFFDYEEICDLYLTDYIFLDSKSFQEQSEDSGYYGIGGYIMEVIERESKKKGKYCSLSIDSNNELIWVNIFPDQYKKLLDSGIILIGSEKKLLILTGMVRMDDYRKEKVLKVWESSEVVLLG